MAQNKNLMMNVARRRFGDEDVTVRGPGRGSGVYVLRHRELLRCGKVAGAGSLRERQWRKGAWSSKCGEEEKEAPPRPYL